MREGVKQVFNRHARVGPEQCMKEDEDTADLSGSHTLVHRVVLRFAHTVHVRACQEIKTLLLATTCDWLQQPQLQMDGARMRHVQSKSRESGCARG